MHAKRIIPCLDVNNGRVVKGTSFVNLRDAGDPVLLMTNRVPMNWYYWILPLLMKAVVPCCILCRRLQNIFLFRLP